MIDKKLMPFDLERALAGDKLIYRNGEPVTVFHYLKNRDITEKICMTVCMNGSLTVHYSNGRICEDQEFPLDLFIAPKIKTYWINIYKNNSKVGLVAIGGMYENRDKAYDSRIKNDEIYIDTIRMEVEE